MVTVNENTVTIPLTNVANAQTINVTLYSVNAGGNLVIPMRVLAGDVSGNRIVNASDISLAKSKVGQPVDATNFKSDVNANGIISAYRCVAHKIECRSWSTLINQGTRPGGLTGKILMLSLRSRMRFGVSFL